MVRLRSRSVVPAALLVFAALCASSCSVPLGPGYTIEKQILQVHFVADPKPHLEISAWYRLRNSGNQPLSSIHIGIPARKTYALENFHLLLDGREVTPAVPSGFSDQELKIALDSPWQRKQKHELTIQYAAENALLDHGTARFVSDDAFSLPSGGWYPEPKPPQGKFAQSAGPPKKWDLSVQVPDGFLVHSSGVGPNTKRTANESIQRFEQRPGAYFPFVVAGRFQRQEVRAGNQTVIFWSRQGVPAEEAGREAAAISKTISTYDSLFGPRAKDPRPVWVVVCVLRELQIAGGGSSDIVAAQGVSSGLPEVADACPERNVDAATQQPLRLSDLAIIALVPTWAGLGRDSRWGNKELPIDELEQYALQFDRLSEGDQFKRENLISDQLMYYHTAATAMTNNPRSVRAEAASEKSSSAASYKSILFFYALEDRFGREHLHAAIKNMVQARRGLGYELQDLIAALERETHQNVAEFTRLWFKHPGIPEDFRARYASSMATPTPEPPTSPSKENKP